MSPDHFQFIIVDECHRSIYGKWQSVLKYFKGAKILGLTATPTPEATPTPAAEQTASGVKVEVKSGTYYASSELNLRSDASADADLISSVAAGTQLNSTGVCEYGWIRVDYNGQTCYASGDFVTATAPTAGTDEAAADTSADTSYDDTSDESAE